MFVLPYPLIDPIAVHLGPLKIHWYGISYVMGILLGWRYCVLLLKHLQIPLAKKDLDDFIPWATLGIVIGGRLGHALFYNLEYYISKPWEIIYIWHPGMSFHGGLIGVIAVAWWFTYKRKISLLALGDIIAAATPIGLFFGRIANFINGELYGRPSTVEWAMVFPHAGFLPRHPSQLYEAFLEGILLLGVLAFLSLYRKWPERRPGAQIGVFMIGYGLVRSFVELFREPDQHIGYLFGGTTLGQWLSLPLVLGGLWMIIRSKNGRPIC